MNVVIINKSDLNGGAAVVSFRLMNALLELGVETSMLVAEKISDSSHVHPASNSLNLKIPFLWERLKIFLSRGVNLKNLFKVDTASDGLPLYRHPLVKNADIICLNWINQGLLSLKGIGKLLSLGKPIVWTMHDMWCFTGICHHAGKCRHYLEKCGDCPLLNKGASPDDLSYKIHRRKEKVYGIAGKNGKGPLQFVAVSNWLAGAARRSDLLKDKHLAVIPNAFPIPVFINRSQIEKKGSPFRIIFGAARVDNPIKGIPILIEATKILKKKYPQEAENMELVTFGNVKRPEAIKGIAIPHRHLGVIGGTEVGEAYRNADAIVSTSHYETLPGTLVEGQAYGCIPIAFDRGGQSDIVDHLSTGYLAEWSDDVKKAAENIADGIIWATKQDSGIMAAKMYESVKMRFEASAIARRYKELFDSLLAEE